MIELEKTYLVKFLPDGIKKCKNIEITDVYFPEDSDHPKLRIRKKGNFYELTKKSQPDPNDPSKQIEQNIELTKSEFESLSKSSNRRIRKIRYYYKLGGRTVEFDTFQDKLLGLMVAEVEFESEKEKETFEMPDFCLVDVTTEEFIAGGMLAGKSFSDIEKNLMSINTSNFL